MKCVTKDSYVNSDRLDYATEEIWGGGWGGVLREGFRFLLRLTNGCRSDGLHVL